MKTWLQTRIVLGQISKEEFLRCHQEKEKLKLIDHQTGLALWESSTRGVPSKGNKNTNFFRKENKPMACSLAQQ